MFQVQLEGFEGTLARIFSPARKRQGSRRFAARSDSTSICALLILALLVVSPVLSSQISFAARQVQPTTKTAVEKSTEPSTCYAVQVAAFEDRSEAAAMLNLLMQAFPYRMTLTQLFTRDKTLWRLRVLATSRVEALKISGRLLEEQGVKAWIVPIPCTYRVKGKLDRPVLARQIKSPALNWRDAQVNSIAPQTESPAPLKREALSQENENRQTASAETVSQGAVNQESAKREATGQATLGHLRRQPVRFGSEMMGIILNLVGPSDGVEGVKIIEVTPNSPAAKAGLVASDIILAIDGNAVNSDEALEAELANRKPGSKMSVTFMHIAWVMQATVTIERRGATF